MNQNKLIQYLDSANTKSPEGSSSIRKNLIFNGIDFIKEAPFSGIGPGAYRTRHITGKVKGGVWFFSKKIAIDETKTISGKNLVLGTQD